jgi:hypothetical protein
LQAKKYYKKNKKTTVQLTSLLDLLFVMIFVSLIQQKNIQQKVEEKKVTKTEVVKTTVVKAEKVTVETPVPQKEPIPAVFEFYATANNPGTPEGSYEMQGTFDEKSGKVNLFGANWIKRPTGFDMVPLNGLVDDAKSSLRGKIDSPWCKTFKLSRMKINPGNSISGIWKGVYDCGQGSTGLTLTIN